MLAEPPRRPRDSMAGSSANPHSLNPPAPRASGTGRRSPPVPARAAAQACSSPFRLVPSGALVAPDAGAALESSFRDLTIP